MVNVTSLTDMFTVILVFLLQTYNTSEVQIETPTGLRVPTSQSEGVLTQGLQLFLTSDKISLGNETILSLNDQSFMDVDIDPKDNNFVPKLFKALDDNMKSTKDAAIKDGKISVVADRNLSYAVIKKVMYTASMAGFPKVKLITTSQ